MARASGTSTATVSLALHNKAGVSARTRARILRVAAELKYQPDQRASLLRRQRSHLIGVVFSFGQDFHALLVDGIYQATSQVGYEVILSGVTHARSEADAVHSVLADRCEGFILLGPRSSSGELADLFERGPVVTIGVEVSPQIDSVLTSEDAGADLAVGHLAELGHRDIWLIDGGSEPAAVERRRSFLGAFARHGLPAPRTVLTGGSEMDDGAGAAIRLLASGAGDLPTALLCHNDLVAIGAILVLRAHGVRVPQDISVVGYDDNRIASLEGIRLTSVHQDPRELASQAAVRLIDRIEGRGGVPGRIELGAWLEARDTTAPPSPVR